MREHTFTPGDRVVLCPERMSDTNYAPYLEHAGQLATVVAATDSQLVAIRFDDNVVCVVYRGRLLPAVARQLIDSYKELRDAQA